MLKSPRVFWRDIAVILFSWAKPEAKPAVLLSNAALRLLLYRWTQWKCQSSGCATLLTAASSSPCDAQQGAAELDERAFFAVADLCPHACSVPYWNDRGATGAAPAAAPWPPSTCHTVRGTTYSKCCHSQLEAGISTAERRESFQQATCQHPIAPCRSALGNGPVLCGWRPTESYPSHALVFLTIVQYRSKTAAAAGSERGGWGDASREVALTPASSTSFSAPSLPHPTARAPSALDAVVPWRGDTTVRPWILSRYSWSSREPVTRTPCQCGACAGTHCGIPILSQRQGRVCRRGALRKSASLAAPVHRGQGRGRGGPSRRLRRRLGPCAR